MINGEIDRRNFSKKLLISATAFEIFAAAQVSAQETNKQQQRNGLRLFSHSPANEWVEAYPIGNGKLGAMVFGGISNERIQLNEGTLFTGGPYSPINPLAARTLPKVRKLIWEHKFEEAEKLANEGLLAVPPRQSSYQPLGDLIILSTGIDNSREYERELNLETAIASTRFKAGPDYHREIFASVGDNVIAMRLRTEPARAINCEFILSAPHKSEIKIENDDTIILKGVNREHGQIKGALSFEIRIKIRNTGGSLKATGTSVLMLGATQADIFITGATSFVNFEDVSGEPSRINAKHIEAAVLKGYDAIKTDHIKEHQSYFQRFSISIGEQNSPQETVPTHTRIEQFSRINDAAFCALYVQYARYLLLSCSRAGGQPANLQGIWNDKSNPSWGSKWTININTEMNYWISGPSDLLETTEPLLKMVEDLTVTGGKVAKEMYGARGWVAFHNTDLWRAATPVDGAFYGIWPMGGAWLLQNLWDVYDFGQDVEYLERLYPLMKSSCEFYLDTLLEHPSYGYFVTNPSISPENRHGFGSSLCAGPTIDNQILRDLFNRTARAARILNTDREFARDCRRMANKLAPNKIGRDGQLQEWIDDWDHTAKDPQHRHVSHLYGLFPSEQISVEDTPELARAAQVTLEKRGDDSTGWGIGWRINLWARLKNGNRALGLIRRLISPQRSYFNLFDAHPPFQIDGNFGGSAGIIEMLIQSHRGHIELLPALPDKWQQGTVKGALARGGFKVDFDWQRGSLKNVTVKSIGGLNPKILYHGRVIKLRLEKNEIKELIF